MRIVHVTLDGGFPRYGIGLAVRSLACAQARAGHDVTIAARADNVAAAGAAEDLVRLVGLVRRSGLLGGRRSYLRQLRSAFAPPPEVVHAHSLVRMAHWLLPLRARAGAPLVVTAHASDELGPTASPAGNASPSRARRHRRQLHAVVAHADAVVAPSAFMRDLVLGTGLRTEVDVIGHGPTDERPVPDSRRSDRFVVTALSRLVPVKGLDLLVDAFAAAFPDDETVRLVIAGEGPEREALTARAHGLGDRVEFPGYVEGDARRALLGRTDVVVMPTRGDYETFGLAALDGSAAGAQVRVAAGGALPERAAVAGGAVVAEATVGAWAAALRGARVDEASRRAARDATLRVFADSSWARSAERHDAVYRRTLRTRGERENRPSGREPRV